MKDLKDKIDFFIKKSHSDEKIIEAIKHDNVVFPFSIENKLLAYLISLGAISFNDYLDLCKNYCERNIELNKYLYLFDMAPRTFGQTWGEQHIKNLFPEFVKATKKNLAGCYPDFDGEFDLWLDGVRIEVKACRANSQDSKGSLSDRAYSHADALAANFKYHYQQLKPSCCDVFIWIGVCKDTLLYWVMTSEELLNTGKLASQHRNENTGIQGAEVYEGQVFMTEEELRKFLVSENDIINKVKEKGNKYT